VKVLWLPEALVDLERVFDFLLARDAGAAERAVRAIESGADRLMEFPEIGQPLGDGTWRRELFIRFGAGGFVLRYRIHRDQAVILRLWHSRESRGQGG